MFLKECKYIEKVKNVLWHITGDIESFSSNPDEEQIKTKYRGVF